MNKFVIAAIAAAAILPSAAMAKPYDRHETKVVVVDHRGPAAHRIAVGQRFDAGFIARQQVIRQPARYHLARAHGNTRWLRVHDDAVLVNLRTGRVIDVVFNRFR